MIWTKCLSHKLRYAWKSKWWKIAGNRFNDVINFIQFFCHSCFISVIHAVCFVHRDNFWCFSFMFEWQISHDTQASCERAHINEWQESATRIAYRQSCDPTEWHWSQYKERNGSNTRFDALPDTLVTSAIFIDAQQRKPSDHIKKIVKKV